MRLLLTRPEPDAERTAAALRARGHAVIVAPLVRIETIAAAAAEIGSGPWAAILITSANAASAAARHERYKELFALPVFAVGERSAQAMRAAGFADATSADGDLGDLVRLVAARLKPAAPLLYLAGADRSGDLAGRLGERGFVVRTVAVYRAIVADDLPHAAAAALTRGEVDGVLHFSRRSAAAFANAARGAGLAAGALEKPIHFCLSAQVAEPLAQAGVVDIRIAPKPAEAALIELISPAQ